MQHMGSLFPKPEIKPMPPAVEAWSLNHWISMEVSCQVFNGAIDKRLSSNVVY